MKVFSPVIFTVTLDQGLELPEIRTDVYEKRCVDASHNPKKTRLVYTEVSGFESVAGR